MLFGQKIGISISEPENINEKGLSLIQLRDVMVELTQQILALGAIPCYGGSLMYKSDFNFTKILIELAQYYDKKPCNYLSYCEQLLLGEKAVYDLYSQIDVIVCEKPSRFSNYTDDDLLQILKNPTPEQENANKELWATSLTEMRERMSQEIIARVVLGGKQRNYKGKMAGIIEETILTVKNNQPVYVITSFGGSAEFVYELHSPNSENVEDSRFRIIPELRNESLLHFIDKRETTSIVSEVLAKLKEEVQKNKESDIQKNKESDIQTTQSYMVQRRTN